MFKVWNKWAPFSGSFTRTHKLFSFCVRDTASYGIRGTDWDDEDEKKVFRVTDDEKKKLFANIKIVIHDFVRVYGLELPTKMMCAQTGNWDLYEKWKRMRRIHRQAAKLR